MKGKGEKSKHSLTCSHGGFGRLGHGKAVKDARERVDDERLNPLVDTLAKGLDGLEGKDGRGGAGGSNVRV